MVKNEYCRRMKSASTYAAISIFTAITIVSFIFALAEKNQFVAQLATANDERYSKILDLVERSNGFYFILNFWYTSDFYFIFLLALLLFAGVFMTGQLQQYKDASYGNLVVSRIGYKKYLNSIIVSQSLYIFTIVIITDIITFIIALIMGGAGYYATGVSVLVNCYEALLIMLAQNIQMAVIIILINGCSLLYSTYVKNKYILQAFPLFLFMLLPQLIASTLANVSDFTAKIILPFVIWNELLAIDYIINDYSINDIISFSDIMYYLIPIIAYLAVFVLLYIANVKKNEKEYI